MKKFASGSAYDLVAYRRTKVSVILDGASSGRTVEDPAGTPMLVGYSASLARFENSLIRALNGQLTEE